MAQADDSAIEFEQVGIGDVLKRYRLKVPPNQRDYAWEEPQVRNLLEDLSLAMRTNEAQHFLGSIVTIKGENSTLQVTDGQQRLATIALTLSAMRQVVGEEHDNLRKLIDGFLSSINGASLEEEPNISLNIADNSVFSSLIVSGDVGTGFIENRESHQLLKQAYNLSKAHLMKEISSVPSNQKWVIFQNWINYIQLKTKVILMIVSSAANSYRMFETLNDRGLRVSQSDLIKNYIFGLSGDQLDAVQQSWASMKASLETLDDDDLTMTFVRHALMVMTGFLQQKNIYDKIQNTTRGKAASVKLMSDWEALAGDYVALSNPESSNWNGYPSKLRENIKVLNLFSIAPIKPILLAATKRFSKNETAKVFEKAVAIGVRLIIASRTTTQSVEKPLADVANKIWEKEITTCSQAIKALSAAIPNDQQFQQAFEIATVSKAPFARYYLRSLERVANGEPDPWLIPNDDTSIINLEHILPKNPDGNWPDWTDDERKAFFKRIGNMVLLTATDNSKLKSASFEVKKPVFVAAPYILTKMVSEQAAWRPLQIENRQKHLSTLALTAWPM